MRCISRSKTEGSVYAWRRTRSGSTILDTSSMGFSYIGFEVGAHALQDFLQGIDFRLRQAVERQLIEPLHFGPDPVEHLFAACSEGEARNAHVFLVGQALEPAGFLHAVDGAGKGGAIDGGQ